MSADNYILVRRHEGKYYVSDESASVPRPTVEESLRHARAFDTFTDAVAYAETQYSEYGIEFDFPVRMVEVDE